MSSRHHAEHVCTIVLGELKSGICFHPKGVGLLRVCCGPKPNCCQFSPRFTGWKFARRMGPLVHIRIA